MARVADYEFSGQPYTQEVSDSTKGAHHGAMQGDAHLDGKGNAMFYGKGDYAVVKPDHGFALNEGTVVIEFTQNSASTGKLPWGSDAAQTLFSVDARGTDINGHLTIFIRADGKVGVRHQTETDDHFFYGGTITPGTPASVGYSWGPGGSTLVVNGQTVATGKAPLKMAGDDLPIVIGASQAQSTQGTTDDVKGHFDGSISRVQIHDKAITTSSPVPCFAAGTMIAVPGGERPVEDLRPGDPVLTADRGAQPLIAVWHRRCRAADLAAMPRLAPIRIGAGALGNARPLIVSRQHALLLMPQNVLVRAIHLARHGTGVRVMHGCRRIDYHHLRLARHEILFANGIPAESLLPDYATGTGRAAPGAMPVRPVLGAQAARDMLGASPGLQPAT